MDNYTKINHFNLVNNYTLKYQYVFGNYFGGGIKFSFISYHGFDTSRNFKGRPFAFPIDSETENITISVEYDNSIYFLELIYNIKNKVIDELKSGETISNFIKTGRFPLFYYLKVKNETYINYDISFRLFSYDDLLLNNDFEIEGYIVNEDTVKRKINGEYIQLNEPTKAYYSEAFKVGLLKINQEIEDNKNYILIQILNNRQDYIDSYLLLEIIVKEKNDDIYYLPVNQYMLQTFDGDNGEIRTENKYYLNIRDSYLYPWEDQTLIVLSSGFSDIEVKFDDSIKNRIDYDLFPYTGHDRYYIYKGETDDIYFSVVNPKKRKDINYMIRYFYTGKTGIYVYTVDLNPEIKEFNENEKSVSISLTFNPIEIKMYWENILSNYSIYFDVVGLLFKKDEKYEQQLNTSSKIIDRDYSFISIYTRVNYSYYNKQKWSIVFENIPKEMNYVYELTT